MSPANDLLLLAPEVRQALADGAAVVALESTITTHGLPRPDNLRAAQAAESTVRAAGAIPATVATRDGRIRVGLSAGELAELAEAQGHPCKVSRQNLAGVLTKAGWGGTTVSATMIAAALAGIEVFATGGIGGVHRGGEASMDISADLDELARTPVTVVCAGPKSILDVGRTLEALETRGVPVAAWQSDDVAGFYGRSSGFPAPLRVDWLTRLPASSPPATISLTPASSSPCHYPKRPYARRGRGCRRSGRTEAAEPASTVCQHPLRPPASPNHRGRSVCANRAPIGTTPAWLVDCRVPGGRPIDGTIRLIRVACRNPGHPSCCGGPWPRSFRGAT
jgi:hypothetical protein